MDVTFSDLDNAIQLSKDKDTEGFDLRAGKSWIYPTNYPLRDYQFSIAQAALHNNTLVSLPTGLGKTFIAAVIMYNYYRWYPMGKIIFMAPTKPLVAQQLDACYNIMAIPANVTAEITGLKINTTRAKIWRDKRVFFITPHILQNDIDTVLDLAPQIKCIVIDEAHRALGKNANCEAIRKIQQINSNFRVLALSATPGSNFNSVKDVITNLLISHIEVKTNESVDVAPYVFQRKLDTIVIPIKGKLLAVKNDYIKVLDVYTRPLVQYNIFSGNCANLTKGRIVLTMKDFKERGRQHSNYGFILRNLNICITLYHGYELLIRHGLRGFLVFFDGNSNPLVSSINELHAILNDVRNYIGPFQDIEMLPDGTIPEVEGEMVYSHPKFQKLSEVLLEHFANVDDTRVMVFCEYRESVMEIYSMLLRHRPTIKPRIFLGKGASMSQAQQLQAVRMFKTGTCNTLVSTCIGEEGLDVGEVDLIVCFDISSKSPIRMVQRMGRTGRKRDGRVVVLVTEGKEQQLLDASMAQKNSMNNLLESEPIKKCLYKYNPVMIPKDIKPECNKMHITVLQPEPIKKKTEKIKPAKKNTIKNMFDNITTSQSSSSSNASSSKSNKPSKSSVTAKRTSPQKRKPAILDKQGDIRSLFTKISTTNQAIPTVNIDPKVYNIDDEIIEDTNLKSLITGIRSYLNTSTYLSNTCRICDDLFDCKLICSTRINEESGEWSPPDNSIFDRLTSDIFKTFSDSIQNTKTPDKTNYDKTKIENVNNDDLDEALKHFSLDSISDIFADDNSDSTIDSYAENPIMFNQSMGIFKSLKPNESFNRPVTPVLDIVDDDIVVSDSDQSPVLSNNNAAEFKRKVLLSQSSTPNPKIVKKLKFTNLIEDLNVQDFVTQPMESTSQHLNVVQNTSIVDLNTNNSNKFNIKQQFKYNISTVENLNITDFDTQNHIIDSNNLQSTKLEPNVSNLNTNNFSQMKNQASIVQDLNINDFVTQKNESNIPNNKTKSTTGLKRNNSSNIKQLSITSFVEKLNTNKLKTLEIDSKSHAINGNNFQKQNANDLNISQSSESKSLANDCKSSNNEALSTSVLNTSIEDDFDIWDASIFEYSDAEDISEANEIVTTNSSNKTENKLTSPKHYTHTTSKQSVKMNDLNGSSAIENPEGDIDYDSDETIILDSDVVFSENLEKPANISNELNKSNSSDCVLLSYDTNYKLEEVKKNSPTHDLIDSTVLNKSVCNKTNNSLLSVTQMIEFLNDSTKYPKNESLGRIETSNSNNLTKDNTNNIEVDHCSQLNTEICPSLTNKYDNGKKNKQNISSDLDNFPYAELISSQVKENNFTNLKENISKNVKSSYKENKITNKSDNHSKQSPVIPERQSNIRTTNLESDFFTDISCSSFEDNKFTKEQSLHSKPDSTKYVLLKENINQSNITYPKPLATICISEDSEEEQSLLSFSQISKNNKHKKFKLSLIKKPDISNKLNFENVLASQSSPVQPPKKKIYNLKKPVIRSDSEEDDDFEMKSTWLKPVKKPNVVAPKRSIQRTNSLPTAKRSLALSQKQSLQSQPSRGRHILQLLENKKKKEQRNKLALNFIDAEAEIEDDEHYVADSEEECDNDMLESSFIDDTQSVLDHTDMQAKYLQSVKSPKFKNGAFKIPRRPPVVENVFSQDVIEQDDTYMMDSFCVGNDIAPTQRNTMTYLEHAEAQLEEWSKEKKTKKRKRILQTTLDDSD